MKSNFQFSNLLGTVYRQGNLVFTSDGNSVLSAVGNRVAVFDLANNTSYTFPFENRKNIARIALSPDGSLLISVDQDGRALISNFRRRVVLHHINFKAPVADISFSPNGKCIAVSNGHHTQVWKAPSMMIREFAPLVLHRTYTGHQDDVMSITWSADSRCFLTTSRDMTARLFTLDPLQGFRPKTFAGHRDVVMGAWFSSDGKSIYTISKDGAVFTWRGKMEEEADDSHSDDEMSDADSNAELSKEELNYRQMANTRWGVYARNYFNLPSTKVVSVTYHQRSSLLVVGFSSGVFGLWEMPTFNNIHTLSVSQEKISSVAINPSGDWLAFGAQKVGQLLVWEWQSESYILKQQGHFFDMNTLTYSPDAQHIATGGDDGKVKVWNTNTGFCFVTFNEHSSAVSTVEFAKQGSVLFSASLDGTVRAFDLIRYRNFRTFTTPEPVQFSSLAVDPSGEVVAAGSLDSFEIYMWSVQTGKIIDVFTGHQGPVSSLTFSPTGNKLVSGSWDKTVRVWDVFTRAKAVEPFQLSSDVLAVAFRPDGKQIAAASLDGQIQFWNIDDGKQVGLIEGRKDVSGGRKYDDRTTAQNSASGKSYNSLAYTADGSCLLAGGNSKYVVLYDVKDGVMLKKFQISENLSLDGTQEFLDSRLDKDNAGFESGGDESDLEDRLDNTLPGVAKGDLSKRRTRLEARTKCVRFSPTGRGWAAASTEGLLMYTLDDTVLFDPFDLDLELTPEAIDETLEQKSYLKAMVMAFRLNETPYINKCYEAVPTGSIRLICRDLPAIYINPLLKFVGAHIRKSSRVEFDLSWITAIFGAKGDLLRNSKGEYAAVLREVHRGLSDWQSNIVRISDDNAFGLQFLIQQSNTVASAEDASME